MRIVCAPDGENVYLSSGSDNLALHQDPHAAPGGALEPPGLPGGDAGRGPRGSRSASARAACRSRAAPATHRDGSVSCYCRDPDGNLIQVLYLSGIEA